MEQTLGHVSFAQTLRRSTQQDGDVGIDWVDVNGGFERRWESLPAIRSSWSLRAALKARAEVERRRRITGRPDLYLFHTHVVSALSAGWLLNSPPVVISLDATPWNYDRVGQAYSHRIGSDSEEAFKHWLNKRAFQEAAFLVSMSDWARRSLIDEYAVQSDRIAVIPPGTDLSLWCDPGHAVTDRTSNPKLRLLFVGGDFRRKGGRLLYDTFAKNFADTCELHVVTKSPEVPTGAGVFVHRDVPPNSAELRTLFSTADVFVLPTLGDVHSIASVEAMAAGLPVVASDIPAHREVAGGAAVLVEPSDVRGVVGATLGMLASDGAHDGTAGRRAARAFSWERSGTMLAELLREVNDGR